jgi:hypothetical protein
MRRCAATTSTSEAGPSTVPCETSSGYDSMVPACDGAEMVLQLRCIVVNGQWDRFGDYLDRTPLKLAPAPLPARTHDAQAQGSCDLQQAA